MGILIVCLLLLACGTILFKLLKIESLHPFLKTVLIFSFFYWKFSPIVLSLMNWKLFELLFFNSISFDEYLYNSIVDLCFTFLLLYLFYSLLKRRGFSELSLFCGDFQESDVFISIMNKISLAILCLITVYSLFSNLNYAYNNNASTIADAETGILTFITQTILAICLCNILFLYERFTKYEIFIQHIIVGFYFLTRAFQGSRIMLIAIIFIYLYLFLVQERKRLYLNLVLSLSAFAIILIPVIGTMRGGARLKISDISSGLMTQTVAYDFIESLAIKSNSVYYGSYLLKYDGNEFAGIAPYMNSFYSLVPRIIYPDKPVPGSFDGTVYGTVSRRASKHFVGDNELMNMGIPLSLESLWTLGWLGYFMAIIVAVFVLNTLNNFLWSKKLIPCLLVLILISFPSCISEVSVISIVRDIPRYIILYAMLFICFVKPN